MMTALIVQKLLFTCCLILALDTIPPYQTASFFKEVDAFSINTPCRIGSKHLPHAGIIEKPTNKPIAKELKVPSNFTSAINIPALATAALATYNTGQNFIDFDYQLCNSMDKETGFRSATFCNHNDKKAIIAFRGTQNQEDRYFDFALFYGQEEVVGSLAKLYSGLGYTQDGLLEALTNFGTFIVEKVNKDYSKKVAVAHKKFLDKLSNQWQHYRMKNYSPHGVAERELNERVGYVSFYTKMEIERFKNLGYDIYLTGHSLGGLYAQLASMMFGLPGVTFNAPGISDVLYHCNNFKPKNSDSSRFINYRHKNDMVSLFRLKDHFGRVIPHQTSLLDPYTAHKMELFVGLLNKTDFDAVGDNDFTDLIDYIFEETDSLPDNFADSH